MLFVMYVDNICVFNVSSCVWVRNGVEILRGPLHPWHSPYTRTNCTYL